jgi:acyl-CoA synthetase (AMP-forming)/AMP-acid ligase II
VDHIPRPRQFGARNRGDTSRAWVAALAIVALLLYAPGLEFIAAFFGCLYAGVVAVPSFPRTPRSSPERSLGSSASRPTPS